MGQVTFWSPVHGQVGNTANVVAVATMIGLDYDIRTLAAQTHFSRSTLERAYMKSRQLQFGSMLDFSDTGIDALERLARTKRLTPEAVRDNAVILEKGRLDLLFGTSKPDEDLYENLNDVIQAIFNYAKQYYDATLLDLHSGSRNLLTNTLLEGSDLIVVSLNQNMDILERFFSKEDWPAALEDKRFVVLLGQYDEKSKCSVANIKRYFGVKQPIFKLPYCSDFKDSFNEKDVLGWFKRSRNITKKHDNFMFFQEVRKVAKAILDDIGVNTQLKSIERGVS